MQNKPYICWAGFLCRVLEYTLALHWSFLWWCVLQCHWLQLLYVYYGQIAAGLRFRKSQRAFPFSAIYWTGWTGFYCTMYAPQLANLFNSLNWFNHTPREVVACSVSVISYIVSLGSHLTTHKTQSGPGICCGYESVTWSEESFPSIGYINLPIYISSSIECVIGRVCVYLVPILIKCLRNTVVVWARVPTTIPYAYHIPGHCV